MRRREDDVELGPLSHQARFFANGGCPHPDAERVTTVDGEHVGFLCPDCDAVLPSNRFEWPIPKLPPYVPNPRLTHRISE
jgi:hypothetical protein